MKHPRIPPESKLAELERVYRQRKANAEEAWREYRDARREVDEFIKSQDGFSCLLPDLKRLRSLADNAIAKHSAATDAIVQRDQKYEEYEAFRKESAE